MHRSTFPCSGRSHRAPGTPGRAPACSGRSRSRLAWAVLPATPDTVYRVGSVSKLFTDLAIMQLVERGLLDLDDPITKYLPDFKPRNRFDVAITLRQLMSHRAGLVREPPLGNYFDPDEPSL